MSDPVGGAPFEKQIRDELARIGVAGLNVGGDFTPQQFLEALRLTPDGAGGRVLFANLTAVLQRRSGQ